MTGATPDRMAQIARDRHAFLTFPARRRDGREVGETICVRCQMVVRGWGMHWLAPCEGSSK